MHTSAAASASKAVHSQVTGPTEISEAATASEYAQPGQSMLRRACSLISGGNIADGLAHIGLVVLWGIVRIPATGNPSD